LVVSAGHFGARWEQIASLHGASVEPMRYEWGEAPRAEELAARLRELGGVDVVFLTHSETSTGVVADVQALAAAAKEAGALVAVVRRERFGMTLAVGQVPLKGKVFRIGHIGWFDAFDITIALAAVEIVLAELGADIERGAAVTAALEAFEHAAVA